MAQQVTSNLTSPSPESPASLAEPKIIPRSGHPISRKNFDKEALWVLERLKSLGFKAYLVGGAVRDLYLQKSPKDYDVATDARPSRLKKIFRDCRIIGRRFRIAHVFFSSGLVVEVATFRQDSPKTVRGQSGIILRDNEYGTPEQDARRRDLTINGLFYDLESFSVIDYVGGVQDLKDGIVRMINEPHQSFREDPVRMIRALRHASRTGFVVEKGARDAIHQNAAEILHTNSSRLVEEVFKDLRGGSSLPFFRSVFETGLLGHILPDLPKQLNEHGEEHPFWRRLQSLDRHTSANAVFSNAVLLSLVLQTILFPDPAHWSASRDNPSDVWNLLAKGFRAMPQTVRVSRRDTERVAQILIAFRKLDQCLKRGRLMPSLSHKTYIGEALDFLQIDIESRGTPSATTEADGAASSEGDRLQTLMRWKQQAAADASRRGDTGKPKKGAAHGNRDKDRSAAQPSRRRGRRRRRSHKTK